MGKQKVVGRLASIPELQGVARLLSEPELKAFVQRIKRMSSLGAVSEMFDFAGLDPSELQARLRRWGLGAERTCFAVWPRDAAGCEVDSNLFIRFYDDLWYPASDDVWVAHNNSGWMIEVNHEEVARLWRFPV